MRMKWLLNTILLMILLIAARAKNIRGAGTSNQAENADDMVQAMVVDALDTDMEDKDNMDAVLSDFSAALHAPEHDEKEVEAIDHHHHTSERRLSYSSMFDDDDDEKYPYYYKHEHEHKHEPEDKKYIKVYIFGTALYECKKKKVDYDHHHHDHDYDNELEDKIKKWYYENHHSHGPYARRKLGYLDYYEMYKMHLHKKKYECVI